VYRGMGFQKLKLEPDDPASVPRLPLRDDSTLVARSLQTVSLLTGSKFVDECIEISIQYGW